MVSMQVNRGDLMELLNDLHSHKGVKSEEIKQYKTIGEDLTRFLEEQGMFDKAKMKA